MSTLSPPSRTLGRTGIEVTTVALGTSGLGRGTAPGSPQESAAVELATAMLASGRTIDTSNEYAGGRSEPVLGLALPAVRDAASRVVTKVDRDPETGAFDRDRVLRSYEESLRRLGVDRVRLLHLHDPYTVSYEEAVAPGGALAGMLELRDSGAVDAIGIAAGPIPLMTRYVDTGAFDVVLSHNRFTLVDRSAAALFENARTRGMGVVNAAPFGAGILATGATGGTTTGAGAGRAPAAAPSYGYRPASAALQDWARRAEAVCAAHGTTLRATALRFSTRSPLVDMTVVGVSSVPRLTQLDALEAETIPDDLWAEIDALGPAPTPIDDDAPGGAG
ncbi:Pyridoxal 4-dehydrogenase [Microbacterium lemovicicum]|uniref:Pyridoxal 4-dehydrogenase n=1 Tax=Microbacterium lemovicicum TaxID=1072463 RepID=A0A3S9WDV7_9MICO|nr:aldo/keto reductase [Microbacterium lemovicicum]AZS38273.1 Pyridoxal 4-dehydrogenase [Microbacterium lemovicicum]